MRAQGRSRVVASHRAHAQSGAEPRTGLAPQCGAEESLVHEGRLRAAHRLGGGAMALPLRHDVGCGFLAVFVPCGQYGGRNSGCGFGRPLARGNLSAPPDE